MNNNFVAQDDLDLYVATYVKTLKEKAYEFRDMGQIMDNGTYKECKNFAKASAKKACPNLVQMEQRLAAGRRIGGINLHSWFQKEFYIVSEPIIGKEKEENNVDARGSYVSIYNKWLSLKTNTHVATDREIAFWLGCVSGSVTYARKKAINNGYELEEDNFGYSILKRPVDESYSLTRTELDIVVSDAVKKALNQFQNSKRARKT